MWKIKQEKPNGKKRRCTGKLKYSVAQARAGRGSFGKKQDFGNSKFQKTRFRKSEILESPKERAEGPQEFLQKWQETKHRRNQGQRTTAYAAKRLGGASVRAVTATPTSRRPRTRRPEARPLTAKGCHTPSATNKPTRKNCVGEEVADEQPIGGNGIATPIDL